MPYAEAYKEHIMYTFNGFCKTVIRFAAINAWRDRSRRRQKEISLEYLTEEKFYPLGTTDEYFEAPYEEYPITICGQTVILTNGELAAALLSLPEKNREIIFLSILLTSRRQNSFRNARSVSRVHLHQRPIFPPFPRTYRCIPLPFPASGSRYSLRRFPPPAWSVRQDCPVLGRNRADCH